MSIIGKGKRGAAEEITYASGTTVDDQGRRYSSG